jgi:ADP-heptose:LPS heptosyltransferase/polysaccharide pyruvyl transferase WcaK-like protein
MRIAVSNPDSIGDFVLRQPFYAALTAAGHELFLVVRSNVAPLAPLVAPGAAVAELVSNPYDLAFDTQAPDVQKAAASARRFKPDVFCIAPYQRTAVDEYLARALEPCSTVGMTGVLFGDGLDGGPGRPAPWKPDRAVEVAVEAHELLKSQLLCGALLGKDVRLPDPHIVLKPHQQQAAGARLESLGILPGSYWIGCVGQSPSTEVRNWSAGNWAVILEQAVTRFGRRILLIGTQDERAATEAIRERMGEAGAACDNLCGQCDTLELAIGLIHHSAGYIGRDTGPMHVAAALDKPVIAVFGGGHWPRFTPLAKKGVALTVPLPCSGCSWMCHLPESYCVKRVTTSAVLLAMDRLEAGEIEGVLIQEQPPDADLLARVAREGAVTARKWGWDLDKRLRAAKDENQKLTDEVATLSSAQDQLLRHIADLEGSLSLRLARSLPWMLKPVRKLLRRYGVAQSRLKNATHDSPIMRAFQIYNGLGAGNIGDELMARAFWDRLPGGIQLDIPLAPESAGQHDLYPAQHRYLSDQDEGEAPLPGLLVGDTPVTAAEGLGWPLNVLAPRLLRFHRAGYPVDALGVGVDCLDEYPDARRIFEQSFAPIRSWTVRSAGCMEALLALGVPASRIRLGADWAWLYRPRRDMRDWAAASWRRWGVDPDRPLLVANVVNMLWRENTATRQGLAAALREAALRFGLQIALFCNESRPGEFFDYAAAGEIAALVDLPHVLVPNEYYSPDEALALLAFATVTVGQRYHFIVESVLAGTVPIGVLRGQKMDSLSRDLRFPVGGSVEQVGREQLFQTIAQAIEQRASLLEQLAARRLELAHRAENNLSFLAELLPYRDQFGSRVREQVSPTGGEVR